MRWDFGSSGGTANSFRRGKVSEKQLTLFRWQSRLDKIGVADRLIRSPVASNICPKWQM